MQETACVLSGETEEWLVEVFQQEVAWWDHYSTLTYSNVFTHSPPHSVTSLTEILRQAIENEEKLLKEIVLPGPSINIKEVASYV